MLVKNEPLEVPPSTNASTQQTKRLDADTERAAYIAAGFRRKKNILALKDLTSMKVYELVQANPTWELKDVIVAVLKGFPTEMPSDFLLEMIQFIFEEWEKRIKAAA